MTEQEALDNLKKYYCEEEDHHSYIRESWQTLELAVKNFTANNSERDDICPICKQKCFPSTYYCYDCNYEFYP